MEQPLPETEFSDSPSMLEFELGWYLWLFTDMITNPSEYKDVDVTNLLLDAEDLIDDWKEKYFEEISIKVKGNNENS